MEPLFLSSFVPMSSPAVGSLAPDFTLPSTSGEAVTLSQHRGKHSVLLAFFPLAFSGTCTKEVCAFAEDYDQFASRDVVVYPISVDHTYSLKEFRAKHGVQSHMLSDFKREVTVLYDLLVPEKFYSKRAYFLIDKEGVVRWAHVENQPGMRRENAEILEQVDRLEPAAR
jgi:peroxiredoxin